MDSKLAHIIVFFLLATSFKTLMARKESDGPEVIKLLKEFESEFWCKGKQFWPELIGVPAKLAKEIIEKENPSISDIPILLNGSPVTMDFRCDRVRLFDNILGYVVQIPTVT
ncbi:wound-induced proteinase inhibitor 1-like [Solanum lycopersicum]|uniref:Wound-induced proteinase inhibitor 1 n=1 Tax=Solanum lycopersicum TaxID=4081 RepID=A0A3Q7J2Q4_SOLLC|nr:wound-induced proteinase inhibitor 1-like [Solanum lycopersicum]